MLSVYELYRDPMSRSVRRALRRALRKPFNLVLLRVPNFASRYLSSRQQTGSESLSELVSVYHRNLHKHPHARHVCFVAVERRLF